MFDNEIVVDLGSVSEKTQAPWPIGRDVDGSWPDGITWVRYWPH